MDSSEFEEMVTRCEANYLDFKQSQYDLDGEDKATRDAKRAKFAKDIISMANTPREEPCYVILGVKKDVDGSFEFVGIDRHYDDAELQEKLKDLVYPIPPFSYEPFSYNGYQFGVICIPPDRQRGPYFPTSDLGGILRRNQLYFRRSSQNAEANHADLKNIMQWFMSSPDESAPVTAATAPSWEHFVGYVESFSTKRRYILVIPPFDLEPAPQLENLGHLPWNFVIDFDRCSDRNGVLNKCKGILEELRVLHRVTKGDAVTLNLDSSTYWYFANGLEGRESTVAAKSWIDWQRQYDRDLRQHLAELARSAASFPCTLVAVWSGNHSLKFLESALSATASAFGESVSFVIVSNESGPYETLAREYEAQLVETRLDQWFAGLAAFQKSVAATVERTCILPSASGAPIYVSDADFMWLSEELEVIHSGTGLHVTSEQVPGRDFLRGGEVSWYDLGLHIDVDRDKTLKASKAVRNDLNKRQVSRINIYHKPGAGGTTVAKRIVWDFHNEFPCAVLKRTEPRETAERLAKIASLTGLPVLVSLDGSLISESASNELFEVLSARQVPVVLLQVLRRFSDQKESERSFSVSNFLSPVEADKFYFSLVREAPASRIVLQEVAKSTKPNERTPFFLTLIAFGSEVTSIKKYVADRTVDLTQSQRKVLLFLSVAHYYGQKAISAQAFAEILNIPQSRSVDFKNVFSELSLELLVEARSSFWRTSHQLIATALLKQLTAGPSATDERVWKQFLSDVAVEFASFCRGNLPETPSEMLELAKRVFVFRDNSELLGTERSGGSNFSELLLNIPSLEGKQRVLEHLTDIFHDEAHFWAHLGRFYFLEKRDFEKAISAIKNAIYLQPDDHVLVHVKGMAIRAAAYDLIEKRSEILAVLEQAKLASDAFQTARIMNPSDEHGYISEIQMINRVVDYAGRVSEQPPVRAVAQSSDPWLQAAFQAAEDLLMQVRRERVGDNLSDYERRCRADLDALYGKHDSALQIWDNLITAKSTAVFAPPIRRQMVWTYLARRGHSWDKLTSKEIERSVNLLEDNLAEEFHAEKDLRLWLQAIRWQQNPPSLETVIEKVAYWKANTDSLEASYYLYVLYCLDALGGSTISRDSAYRAIEECRIKSRLRVNRTKSFEWLGDGSGVKQLVHHELLGSWDYSKNFWSEETKLLRVKGLISKIEAPQAGEIEISNGLKAFFVPNISGHQKGRSENTPITCFIGFSYDGLKAWSVEDA